MVIRFFCNYCKYYNGLSCKINSKNFIWKVMEINGETFYHKALKTKVSDKDISIRFCECKEFKDIN